MVQEPDRHGDEEEPGPFADLVADDAVLPGPRPPADEAAASSLKIFLIADIRGYTRFTHERGDEAAGKLAAKFALVTRDVVGGSGGELLELRGDEALVVFDSARQALRAAVALQQRCVTESQWMPELPLPVGMGLDVGEAVRVESGYRGRALNLAARLCSAAAPGEVLASREVTHLAGQTDDLRFTERANLTAKGLPGTLVAVAVRPVGEDPAQQLKALGIGLRPPAPPRAPRPRLLVAGVAAVCVAVAAVLFAVLGSSGTSVPVVADSVARLSASDGAVTADLPFASEPDGVVVVGTQVWATNRDHDTVTVYDTRSHGTQTIPVGHQPGGIASAAGSVWVANAFDGTVSRINDASLGVVQTIRVGANPSEVAADANGVWVTNSVDDTVSRIDPVTGSVVATIPVGQAPVGVAVGPGSVWVTNSADATVSQIAPGTNAVIATVSVGQEPTAVAVGGGAVWVANTLDGTLSRIDPATGSVTATVAVGGGPTSLVAAGTRVWVADDYADVVTEVSAGRVVRHVRIDNAPAQLTLAAGSVWVSVQPGIATHRGGTLRLVGSQKIGPYDPADPSAGFISFLMAMTYDQLVSFNHVGGAAGSLLVPDLATSLPTPTDGGQTYTFRLRTGIRYSTGQLLKASDVRSSFERMGREQTTQYIPSVLLGGSGCTPKACDLSRAIVTDDATGTVTFHLAAPDPDFLYQLTLGSVVPAGTPVPDQIVPGTGPYLLEGPLGRHLKLVRNPFFHEWSHAAQPAGFPDTVLVDTTVPTARQLPMVESGQADWSIDLADYTGTIPPGQLRDLRLRFPTLYHQFPLPSSKGIFFNVKVAPFDSFLAREGINYAIDRAAVSALSQSTGVPTCQFLPPNFPGHRPYCPYTVDPNPSGRWVGPDLAKATALLAASHTLGTPVTFIIHQGDEAAGHHLVGLLNRLGYPTTLKDLAFGAWVNYIFDTRNRAQAGLLGWVANYPSAADLLSAWTCQHFAQANPAVNINASEFCDPVVQRLYNAGVAAQASNRVSAPKLFAAVDRVLVDRAVWAPIFNVASLDAVSPRVGNYQNSYGVILDQLWLR